MEIEINRERAAIGILSLLLVLTAGLYVVQIQQKNTAIQEKSSKINSLETKNSNLTSQVSTLKSKRDNLQSELTQTKNSLNEVKNRGVVYSSFSSWRRIAGSTDQYRFNMVVYNAGSGTAENIEVICGIEDGDTGEHYFVKTENAGGLASHSSKTLSYEYEVPEETAGDQASCHVKSCENCLNADRAIPTIDDLIEEMTGAISTST